MTQERISELPDEAERKLATIAALVTEAVLKFDFATLDEVNDTMYEALQYMHNLHGTALMENFQFQDLDRELNQAYDQMFEGV